MHFGSLTPLHFFPLSLLPNVAYAHARVTSITSSTSPSTIYTGFDPALSNSTTPLAAWSAHNLGNIYVSPSSFSHPNITCHNLATPGLLHVKTSAGATLTMSWNEWPVSHKGPVLTYLAACPGSPSSCAHTVKEKLRWVKIDQLGWINDTSWELGLGGTWASDMLIAKGFKWDIRVPSGLREGAYVIRHEILALHVAEVRGGAQAYPQCVNIWVDGDASESAKNKKLEGGLLGTEFYREDDKGVLVDIHGRIGGYDIPGPALWEGLDK